MRTTDGGGGGLLGGITSGINNIGAAAAKSGKKKKSSTGSGAGRATSGAAKGVNNIGRSVANSGRSSSGGSGRRSGGSSSGYRPSTPPRVVNPRPPVGNTPSGVIAKSVPPPAPPMSIDDYLAKDTAYGSQKSAYQKALSDYAAQMQAEQGKYTGEYEAQTKQLGLDRQEGLTNLADDYAGRGLINSGVYGDALGDMTKKFDTQAADMERAKQAYLDDLKTGQTNFQTTQQTLLEKARQDALNRRLDSLKV